MKPVIILLQTLLLIALSPLVSGIIRKIKNTLRMRKGAGILQPYYNLSKLLSKEEVISDTASWIFQVTPYIVFSSITTALFIVPAISSHWQLNMAGDFLVIIFLLALGRFFISLAALDTGSAFGGMGSSREMFISSFVEPVALLSIFTVSMKAGTTSLSVITSASVFTLSSFIAAAALFFVTLAETSRLPVDNQETHLELTMVHEAMALEYSGRSLALIELASHIKQILFFTIVANILLPLGLTQSLALPLKAAVFFLKILGLSLIVSLIEVSIAKMRLFRVVDFLAFGFILSIISMIAAVLSF